MRTLGIDIETYSSVDIKSAGMYKYVESPDFEIILFSYSADGGQVKCVDLKSGEKLPDEVYRALPDPNVLKTAHNAAFEIGGISEQFPELNIDPLQWECTMVKASMLGLPLALEQVAKVLQLSIEKDTAGKSLIRYFSIPCKPTKTNGGRTRNLPGDDLDRWEQYKTYNIRDVEVEQEIRKRIEFFQIPATEKKLWVLDQKINAAGIMVDDTLIKNAIKISLQNTEKLTAEAIELTGLRNPNSVSQLKEWITGSTGEPVENLTKESVPILLKNTDCEIVKRVLEIRQEMSKTSVKKYSRMLEMMCNDGRIRGLFQFCGAGRTWRWAGRGVQVHNLPKNSLPDLDFARRLVLEDNYKALDFIFDSTSDTLSQLIRTAFIAPKGCDFKIPDFSAIEAVVIAWLAGEKWRLDVFNSDGKIYEASAAQMFKVPIEQVTKGSHYRQKAKIAELALGYQGAQGALEKMGAVKMGLKLEELPQLVQLWRNANEKIVQLWYAIEDCALSAIMNPGQPFNHKSGIKFIHEKGSLFIQLPSGRRLCYIKARLGRNKFNSESIIYEGVDQTKKIWCKQETYGGKLVENITQAIARDCLADAMLRIDAAGYKIVMHVHDEIVCECPNGQGSIEEINRIMSEPIPWAPGLPLRAESFETEYYKKD
jgi:DNA polymerase